MCAPEIDLCIAPVYLYTSMPGSWSSGCTGCRVSFNVSWQWHDAIAMSSNKQRSSHAGRWLAKTSTRSLTATSQLSYVKASAKRRLESALSSVRMRRRKKVDYRLCIMGTAESEFQTFHAFQRTNLICSESPLQLQAWISTTAPQTLLVCWVATDAYQSAHMRMTLD